MKKRNPHIISKILMRVLQTMQQNPDPYVMNPGKDFSRNRSLPFRDVILIILTMASHTTKKELYNFFSPLKKQVPYNSAFSQQREKLNDSAFPHILSALNKACPFQKKMKGVHVVACDGSDANIPADIRECSTFIPYNSRNGGYHQVHVNALYDLFEERYLDAVIQPRGDFSEIAAACDMVDRNPIGGKTLYIFDRGYECFNLMAHISEAKQYFLIRAKDITSAVSTFRTFNMPGSDEFDRTVTLFLSRSHKPPVGKTPASCRWIRPQARFDYIATGDRDTVYTLTFRLIRIRLDNGTFEYLLTNLPGKTFGMSDMKDLYNLRWGIETSFLRLKYNVCLNYFHSIKMERIYQEIFAKLIFYNFISLIRSCVEVPDRDTKYDYGISFSDSVYLCRDFLLGRQSWDYVHNELLRHLTPVRPGRKYPRNVASQRLKCLQHRS